MVAPDDENRVIGGVLEREQSSSPDQLREVFGATMPTDGPYTKQTVLVSDLDALSFEQVDNMFAHFRSPATLAHARLAVKRAFELRDNQRAEIEMLWAYNSVLATENMELRLKNETLE